MSGKVFGPGRPLTEAIKGTEVWLKYIIVAMIVVVFIRVANVF